MIRFPPTILIAQFLIHVSAIYPGKLSFVNTNAIIFLMAFSASVEWETLKYIHDVSLDHQGAGKALESFATERYDI